MSSEDLSPSPHSEAHQEPHRETLNTDVARLYTLTLKFLLLFFVVKFKKKKDAGAENTARMRL